jgi:beta-glucanase (GH16 family)
MRRFLLDQVGASTTTTTAADVRTGIGSLDAVDPNIRPRRLARAPWRCLLALALLAPATIWASSASAAPTLLRPPAPLAAASAAQSLAAEASPKQKPKEIIVRHPVSRSGFFAVRVTLIGGKVAYPLNVAVSRARAEALTLNHRAVLREHVWSHGSAIVVRVQRSLAKRLRVRIKVHRLPSPVLLVREHVVPGLYNVKIIVSARSQTTDNVSLTVGAAQAQSVATRHRHPATVTEHVTVAGNTLAIRASGSLARPRVKIKLAKLNPAPVAAPTPAAAPSAATTPEPSGDPGTWNLVFDDEFQGSSLNTSKWSTGWFGSGITRAANGAETACYDPSHVSEGNDQLDLTLTGQSAGCSQPYDGAAVTTNGHFQFTYGFVEVRAWLAGNGSTVYDWPQIWLDGQNWPADGEIDLLEGLGGSACYHWHGPPNGTGYGNCPSGSFAGGWHTFGADWEPGSVTYYYDGVNVGSVTNSTSQITGDPMYLILIASTSSGSDVQAPVTERFSYVRVWQH